jgi:exodeoxyribonuclease VII large subunit
VRGHVDRERAAWRARDAALRAHAQGRRVALGRERLLRAREDLEHAMRARLERARARLARESAALDSLSPLAVLARGYGLVRRVRDGRVVRDAADAPPGEALDVRVARAELAVRVESARDRD